VRYSGVMTTNDQEHLHRQAEDYRRQANECLQQAESAGNPLDKEAWLRMAAQWTRLAQDVERRRG